MDHKEFFEKYGRIPVDSDYLAEDLYQAFKQRLCEELRIKIQADGAWKKTRLIDTTDQEASRG